MSVSAFERKLVFSGISNGLRMDGRSFQSPRPITVRVNPVDPSPGSVTVCFGDCCVTAGARLELQKPTTENADQGSVDFSISMAGLSDDVDAEFSPSYRISLLIAKAGKPHTIGEELIMPAIAEVVQTVLHQDAGDVTRKIALSNDTVQRRIDAMAEDTEHTLCCMLRETEFSLELDESTLPGNESLLLAYVRFIREERFVEELLFSKELSTDTRGESIFQAVEEFFIEKGIPLQNVIAVATDGASAMPGCQRGFISYLKSVVPNVLSIHCVLHRQHLVARRLSPRLHESLRYVINAINKVKSNALNDGLFRRLCDENNEDFNRLLLHTEVRWLSKGACLSRFFDLYESVVQFFEQEDALLSENLRNRKADIAYLVDLYFKFNEMNKQLQAEDLNLIKTKSVICAFMSKLLLFKRNFGRGELSQFQSLAEVRNEGGVCEADVELYCEHLQALHDDFTRRFQDILCMVIPDWVINPLSNVDDEEISLQEELLDLQSNVELKARLSQGYQQFWLQKEVPVLYPRVWGVCRDGPGYKEAQSAASDNSMDERLENVIFHLSSAFRINSTHALKSLCVKPGVLCWHVHITILVFQYCGNLVDTCSIAANVLLHTMRIPVIDIRSAKEQSATIVDLNADPDEFLTIDMSDVPLLATVVKIGRHCLIDPTEVELSGATCSAVVGTNRQCIAAAGQICYFSKNFGNSLDFLTVVTMMNEGSVVINSIYCALMEVLSDQEKLCLEEQKLPVIEY
ncbi:hypothetical protein M514_03171 [Trichuris suis]|uniref:Uncharacterized protein n=1 Tax=Trichuris suis TaxID=68888 RepID=A0A085MFQ1_9BILA|nr:hypothetical protein M513_03171 [Trichuris suis]KFD65993.1 hypothetical protein M514_03171 [Trichuris suis]